MSGGMRAMFEWVTEPDIFKTIRKIPNPLLEMSELQKNEFIKEFEKQPNQSTYLVKIYDSLQKNYTMS